MDSCGQPWNLNSFAAVTRGILQTGPWNLAKFALENCGLYSSVDERYGGTTGRKL